MSNWIPTNELRFVERKFKWISSEGDYEERVHPVIQQKWVGEGVSAYTGEWEAMEEWRDIQVRLENEE